MIILKMRGLDSLFILGVFAAAHHGTLQIV